MEESPSGEKSIFPEGSKELLRTAYDRHNIVYHLDDGCMGESDMIPFDESTDRDELTDIYYNYFLHGDENNWRVGVFHYAVLPYNAGWAGFVFGNGHNHNLDSFQISSNYHENMTWRAPIYDFLTRRTFNKKFQRDMNYAAVFMHETGHTLGIFNSNTPGCDDSNSEHPLELNYWKWRPYKSCMNYGYIYSGVVDYSDGSRGKNDFNDWERIDLTFFQRGLW